ncbi:MAG: hypothetical protein JWO70_4334 [Betaproteobacteria bacterium]|nr:hypothetical protein [Betaproteobacteria bacterium]
MFRRRGKDGKANGCWYFHHPVTGRKISSGTKDKELAKQKLRALEQEKFDRETGKHIDLWEVAAGRWMELHAHLANYRSQQNYHDFWLPHLAGMRLDRIDEELVHDIIMSERGGRLAVNLKERCSANSTANLYVWFVAKIIRSGKVAPPKFHKYPASKKSKPWLRPEEWPPLERALPHDLRRVVTFALATGLRISNVIGFRWEWLHTEDSRAYLPVEVTKTDEDYGIPLNRTARNMIAECRQQVVRHPERVFTSKGQPWAYTDLVYELKRACRRAGAPIVTPHGLRHTFASWLSMEGVSDTIRRRLGCWQLGGGADAKYLHFDVEKLRRFAETIDPLLCPTSVSGRAENALKSG